MWIKCDDKYKVLRAGALGATSDHYERGAQG